MAHRVSDAEVKELFDDDVGFDTTNFIDTANVIINEHLASVISSVELLTKIELYLAAHFVTLTFERGGLVRSAALDASETYANVFKSGFRSTRYGQQALALDYTSTLQAVSRDKLTAKFRVV